MKKELHYFNETIGVYRNALSKNLCDKIISLFESPNVQQNHVEQGKTFTGVNIDNKNSLDAFISNIPEFSDIQETITTVSNKCIDDYVRKWDGKDCPFNANSIFGDGTYYPGWKMQKYAKGEGHYNSWHVESDPCHKPSQGRCFRIFAVMFYLNDVAEGGQTSFLYSNCKIAPRAGTFICWPATWPWVHSGATPISDNKYILTTWLQGVWAKEVDAS